MVAAVLTAACGAAGEREREETRLGPVAEHRGGEQSPGDDVGALGGEAPVEAKSPGSPHLPAVQVEGDEGLVECEGASDEREDASSGDVHAVAERSLSEGDAEGGESAAPVEAELAETSGGEAAPKGRVVVRMTGSKGSVEPAVIRRVLVHVAQTCHRRALRRDPAVVGRFDLKFSLAGDYRGPKTLQIGGREDHPKFASCLRHEMDRTRWPTGHLCGIGIFEARVEFSVVDAP